MTSGLKSLIEKLGQEELEKKRNREQMFEVSRRIFNNVSTLQLDAFTSFFSHTMYRKKYFATRSSNLEQQYAGHLSKQPEDFDRLKKALMILVNDESNGKPLQEVIQNVMTEIGNWKKKRFFKPDIFSPILHVLNPNKYAIVNKEVEEFLEEEYNIGFSGEVKNEWRVYVRANEKLNEIARQHSCDLYTLDRAIALRKNPNTKLEFKFVKKDFESTTEKKSDAEYRRERFKLLEKVLTEHLSPYFKNFQKAHHGRVNKRATIKQIKEAKKKGLGGAYVSYSWFGYHLEDVKWEDVDEIQFQISLDAEGRRKKRNRLPVTAGLWLDANNKMAKKYARKQITENSKKFFDLLQQFPTYSIGLQRGGNWDTQEISDLKEEEISKIADELKFGGTEFMINRGFTQREAISLKNEIVDEFSNTFDELIPIHDFLSKTKILTSTMSDPDPMPSTPDADCDEFKKKGYFEILEKKLQMIFYGPPGTGKTWAANNVAKCFVKYKIDGKTPDIFLDHVITDLAKRANASGYTFEKYGTKKSQNMFMLKNDKREIRVDFHKANTDYFQVDAGTKFLTEHPNADNYLVLTKEKDESFVCIPYEVEQEYSKFVKEGDGTGGWDPTGKGKHSVHNLKINRTEAYFEPKDGDHDEEDMTRYLNTWDALNTRLAAVDMTFKEAAIKILLQEGESLHYKEITKRALRQNLIQTVGETPELTLLKNMSEDIRENDESAIFKKTDEGVYGLNDYSQGKEWFGPSMDKSIYNVTFHPSYAYEDFVEGFRPNIDDESSSGYHLDDGIFRDACKRALLHPDRRFVLVIDEINRGNISKIFGELISLIEAEYRGPEWTLSLAYSKKEFYVPKNLYIIGTMNTADKSLAQVDAALRRRFAFEELMPDPNVLKKEKTGKVYTETVMDILKHLNKKITEDPRQRSEFRDKQIGHSYFMKVGSDEDLQFVFKHEIIPLLQDYFYYDYDRLRAILGHSTSDTANDGIIMKDEDRPNEKIFEKAKAGEFVAVLRRNLGIVDTPTQATGTDMSENT